MFYYILYTTTFLVLKVFVDDGELIGVDNEILNVLCYTKPMSNGKMVNNIQFTITIYNKIRI